MEVEEQIDLILSRRTFSSETVRERTRSALIKTLSSIAAIKSYLDEDAYENAPSDIRQDDSDGIPCTTIDAVENAQQNKKNDLRQRSRDLFSDDELMPEVSSGGIMAPPDINRRLKWGYTLLHFAAIAGDETECVRLLAEGADKTIPDNGGKLPWQKAALKGYDGLADKLKP